MQDFSKLNLLKLSRGVNILAVKFCGIVLKLCMFEDNIFMLIFKFILCVTSIAQKRFGNRVLLMYY